MSLGPEVVVESIVVGVMDVEASVGRTKVVVLDAFSTSSSGCCWLASKGSWPVEVDVVIGVLVVVVIETLVILVAAVIVVGVIVVVVKSTGREV